ncbi:MAG: DUF4176 domain-containing protein [Bacilli bacterium]|nr:DUF4176 domain-containing protein [Bacilli bacterium]
MNEKFLPVGSVVLLKEATRGIVIIGYSVVEEGSQKIWDYLGAAYPIGVISPDKNLLFNRNQIDKVLFEGYKDKDEEKFLNALTESMNKIYSNHK